VNPTNTGASEGAVQCFVSGQDEPRCKPDVWKLECNQRTPPLCPGATIPAGAFCPTGQIAVFPFCEQIQTGGIKQPWATWSDLSFIAAGLWLLWFFHYFGREGETSSGTTFISMSADNPMITVGWLSITYAFIVIFMGPPSQWFHASLKDWGGWFDTMSVVAWLMFNAVYVIYMLTSAMWDKGRGVMRTVIVLCVWAGLMIISGLIAIKPEARLFLYFGGGVPWGIAEVIYVFVALKGDVKYRRTWWLFVINLILLAVTMTIWIFFNDGIVKTGCASRQGFPGHALFHILASFSTILTFFSFASERRAD
jgi:hypothetical protein